MLAVYVTLGVVAFGLNTFFIAMLWWRPKVGLTHRHYLSGLAVFNLQTCLLCLNWDIRTDSNPLGTSVWVCILQFYGVQIGVFSSMGTVVAMSLDKCVAIRRPALYKKLCTVRNTRISLALIYASAAALSLLPTGDFLANLSPRCTVIDLYPRRYGVTVVATVLLTFLLAQISALSAVVVNLSQLVFNFRGAASATAAVTAERLNRGATMVKAQRATRIIICSSVLYTLTVVPLAAFFYWVSRRDLGLEYILTHRYSVASNCMLIVLTYIDPFIYFLCVVRWPSGGRVHPASNDS